MNHGFLHRHTDCDNAIRNGGTTGTSGCTMMCAGDATQACGGWNRLNLYNTNARTLCRRYVYWIEIQEMLHVSDVTIHRITFLFIVYNSHEY
jgi:hypothetical protein